MSVWSFLSSFLLQALSLLDAGMTGGLSSRSCIWTYVRAYVLGMPWPMHYVSWGKFIQILRFAGEKKKRQERWRFVTIMIAWFTPVYVLASQSPPTRAHKP